MCKSREEQHPRTASTKDVTKVVATWKQVDSTRYKYLQNNVCMCKERGTNPPCKNPEGNKSELRGQTFRDNPRDDPMTRPPIGPKGNQDAKASSDRGELKV